MKYFLQQILKAWTDAFSYWSDAKSNLEKSLSEFFKKPLHPRSKRTLSSAKQYIIMVQEDG